jgi:hypothetical protein
MMKSSDMDNHGLLAFVVKWEAGFAVVIQQGCSLLLSSLLDCSKNMRHMAQILNAEDRSRAVGVSSVNSGVRMAA